METNPLNNNLIASQASEGVYQCHRFSHAAMATIFEIYIHHPDPVYAQQAAGAAFERLDRLEQDLSRFIEGSDIARINNLLPNQSLVVGLYAFQCLQISIAVYDETFGAFDISFGSILHNQTESIPTLEDYDLANKRSGIQSLTFDERNRAVTLKEGRVQIDLGGMGKGYALDQMAAVLREWEVETALLHGGWSTALALQAPSGTEGWPITISEPESKGRILNRYTLKHRAFSGSGIRKGFHIVDPRTSKPVTKRRAAWAGADTGARADALSTAFMVMTFEEVKRFCIQSEDTQIAILDDDFSNRLWEYPGVRKSDDLGKARL